MNKSTILYKTLARALSMMRPHNSEGTRRLTDWLQGLGMGLDYMNYAIVQLAEKWHDCKLTEKQAEKITANWWSHIAFKMIQFSREG